MKRSELRLVAMSCWMVLTLTIVGASPLESQQGFSFDGRAGVALPVGGIADVVDPGPSFGVRIGHSIGSRLDLGVRGELDLLPGADLTMTEAPDMKLWRYGAGLDIGILQSPSSRWSLIGELGLGATTFDTEEFTVPDGDEPSAGEFSETYLTPSAGLRLGFNVSPRVMLHLGATGHWMRIDEDDTQVLAMLDPAAIEPFSSAWSVPVTLGIRVHTGRRTTAAPPAPAAEPVADRPPPPPPAQPEEDESERENALAVLRERVHFAFDMSEISSEAAAVLNRKVDVLARYPEVRLLIEGHADERGSTEYNQALGIRRATAVQDYLIGRGVAAGRLQTTSMGEERPLSTASNESAWAQNRRAEFVVQNPNVISMLAW